jgi:hypothetical protein
MRKIKEGPFEKYLRKRALSRPLLGRFNRDQHYRRAIVIPALGEEAFLPATLQSISKSTPVDILTDTLVLVIVNNPPLRDDFRNNHAVLSEWISNNARTLKWLERESQAIPLQLGWIDASSSGNELTRRGGVGLARKIGCDSLLAYLKESGNPLPLQDFILFSLDADTLVESNYLSIAENKILSSGKSGGIVSFKHQPAETPEAQAAIDTYELFLNHYVEGLRLAGSPYAFHTIGSCLCFTAMGYIRANGFPASRQAGEDFYFCVELIKTGGICEINHTRVFPSSRISSRVPFGTGRYMTETLGPGEKECIFYDPRVFLALQDLLAAVCSNLDHDAEGIYACIHYPLTRDFLEERDFPKIWSQFRQQYRDEKTLLSAFHRWFDGFVTLKYVHYLTERVWPRRSLDQKCEKK